MLLWDLVTIIHSNDTVIWQCYHITVWHCELEVTIRPEDAANPWSVTKTHVWIGNTNSGVEDNDRERRNVPPRDQGVTGHALDLGAPDEHVGPVQRVHQERAAGDEDSCLRLELEDRNFFVQVLVFPEVGRRLLRELELHDSVFAPEVNEISTQFNYFLLNSAHTFC